MCIEILKLCEFKMKHELDQSEAVAILNGRSDSRQEVEYLRFNQILRIFADEYSDRLVQWGSTTICFPSDSSINVILGIRCISNI